MFFSFSFAHQYQSDFEVDIRSNISIRSVQNNIKEFNTCINILSKSLTNLNIAQLEAQNKLDTLQKLFELIDHDVKKIGLRKVKLEDKIHRMRNKSEKDIKKDAVYMAVREVISENQYIGVIISIIVGLITGVVSSILIRRMQL